MSVDILIPSLLAEKLKEVSENGRDSEFTEIAILSGATMVLKKDILDNSTEQILQVFISGLDLQELLQFETAIRLIGRAFQRYTHLALSPDNIYYIPGQDISFYGNYDEDELASVATGDWSRKQGGNSDIAAESDGIDTEAAGQQTKTENYMETSWGPVRQLAGGQNSKAERPWGGMSSNANIDDYDAANYNGDTSFAENLSEEARPESNGDDFLPNTWGPLSDAPNGETTMEQPVRSRSQLSHNTDSALSLDSYNTRRSNTQRQKATQCTIRLLVSNMYAQSLFRKDYSQISLFRQLNVRYNADRMFITPISSSLTTVPRNQFCYVPKNDAGSNKRSNKSDVLKWPRIVQFNVDISNIAGITGDIARLLCGKMPQAPDSVLRLILSERCIQCLTAQEETLKDLSTSSNCQIWVCEENLSNSDERVVVITGAYIKVGRAIHKIYSIIHSKMRLADIHKPIRLYVPAETHTKDDTQPHMAADEPR
jgi:hypothetical protein